MNYYTLNEFHKLLKKHPGMEVKIASGEYTRYDEKSLSELISWRGSYFLPCITPSVDIHKTDEIAKVLDEGIDGFTEGYKGGLYVMNGSDEFYISAYGESDCLKMAGYSVEDNTLYIHIEEDSY